MPHIALFLIALVTQSFLSLGQKKVVFHEQFDENDQRWFQGKGEEFEAVVSNGMYRVQHKREIGGWYFSYSAYLNQKHDWEIESSMRQVAGGKENGTHLFWGGKESSYFVFGVSSDGRCGVARFENGNYQSIVDWQVSEDLNPLGYFNKLRVRKKGKRLLFYINDKLQFKSDVYDFYGNDLGIHLDRQLAVECDYIKITSWKYKVDLVDDAVAGRRKTNLGRAINTPYDDLGPIISPDGKVLYFFRKNHPQNLGSNNNDDVWYSVKDQRGQWVPAHNLGRPVNNVGHNFISSVSSDGRFLLLNNQYFPNGSVKGPGFSLSRLTKKGWSTPSDLVIKDFYNTHKYITGCLSYDNKAIVMSIEQHNSYGDSDLYVSFALGNGKLSKPLNLGPVVNSLGSEISPFLAADNRTLYFSSNGHPGYGNSDIFVTRRIGDSWTEWTSPQNLGPEINTERWDAYFSIPASGDQAYLVSSEMSIGEGDIFSIDLPEGARPEAVVLLKGIVYDKSTGGTLESDIVVKDLVTGENILHTKSDPETGGFQLVVAKGHRYGVFAEKKAYFPLSESLYLNDVYQYEELEINLYLQPIEYGKKFQLNNVTFKRAKAEFSPESKADLERLKEFMQSAPEVQVRIEGHTDNQGHHDANQKLSEDRAKAVVDYLVAEGIDKKRLKWRGFGDTQPIALDNSEEQRKLNRRVEFEIIK